MRALIQNRGFGQWRFHLPPSVFEDAGFSYQIQEDPPTNREAQDFPNSRRRRISQQTGSCGHEALTCHRTSPSPSSAVPACRRHPGMLAQCAAAMTSSRMLAPRAQWALRVDRSRNNQTYFENFVRFFANVFSPHFPHFFWHCVRISSAQCQFIIVVRTFEKVRMEQERFGLDLI